MKHELMKLPYSYNALEPYIDTQTVEIHYSKHHQNYVNNLNVALENYPDLQNKALDDLLRNLNNIPETVKTQISNNGGGVFNHNFYWNCITPHSTKKPGDKLGTLLDSKWGNFQNFKEEFSKAALSKFGSGWIWLVKDTNNNLEIVSTSNQECPITKGLTPLLTIDVWEHAYYLKYQNRRTEYISGWWEIINWDFVEST